MATGGRSERPASRGRPGQRAPPHSALIVALLVGGLAVLAALPASSQTVILEGDLYVTAARDHATAVFPGDPVDITITAGNRGPSGALAADVTVVLDSGLVYAAGEPCAGQSGPCVYPVAPLLDGPLPPATIQTGTTVTSAGPVSFSARIDTDEPHWGEVDPTDNATGPITIPRSPARVAAVLDDGGAAPRLGETVQYTLTVVNAGGAPARYQPNVALPPGLRFATTPPSTVDVPAGTRGAPARVDIPLLVEVTTGAPTVVQIPPPAAEPTPVNGGPLGSNDG